MAQFYTLEEAARVLGMSAEELKSKAQSREVRAFLDGGSWRFRVVDVDELARRRGLGSDAELRLSDLEVPAGKSDSGEVQDLDLSEFQLGVAKPDLGAESVASVQGRKSKRRQRLRSRHPARRPGAAAQPDHRLELGDHRRSVLGQAPQRLRRPARARHVKSASDSDVQLASPGAQAAERFRRDPDQGRHGRSRHSRLRRLRRHGGAGQPVRGLVGGGAGVRVRQRLRAEPVERADRRAPARLGQRFRAQRARRQRRIRGDPARQGERLRRDGRRSQAFRDQPLSAQRFGDQPPDRRGLGLGQADSIELAPLSDEQIPTTKSPKPPAAKPSKPKPSLAATPPPAVKKGEKDIFDDTDFEVDVPSVDADSDDKTVQLEAASDFDLEDSDTGSEVFAIDEEAVDQNASTAMAPSAFAEDEEDEEDDGFDSAVSSEMTAGWSSSGVVGQPRTLRRRPWSSPASPRPSGAASGSACWASPRCSSFSRRSSRYDLVRNLYEFQSRRDHGLGLGPRDRRHVRRSLIEVCNRQGGGRSSPSLTMARSSASTRLLSL